MPTLFEFLHEFVSHHVAFEGTLVASLKRLLFSPGRLTLDYFDGKRARYVAPLRLYLTFNVVFFLAIELFQVIGLGSISQDVDAKKAGRARQIQRGPPRPSRRPPRKSWRIRN